MKNTIITKAPTLTTSSNNTSDASGLYSSTATNSGDATYYFRGAVENNYYLNNNTYFWTMSPAGFNSSYHSNIWCVGTADGILSNYPNDSRTFRPVINLVLDVKMVGTGTSTDPFVVS